VGRRRFDDESNQEEAEKKPMGRRDAEKPTTFFDANNGDTKESEQMGRDAEK
jgi:hypothetical protein